MTATDIFWLALGFLLCAGLEHVTRPARMRVTAIRKALRRTSVRK